MPKPIPLPLVMKFQGDKLTQRKRSGNVAWYRRGGYCIEIILIRIVPESTFGGYSYPAREAYPGSSQFGNLGWCFSHPEKTKREELAESKFKTNVRAPSQRV